MPHSDFPPLDSDTLIETRDACHAYSAVLGAWATVGRQRRKHSWQLSLRPSLNGVTTGVIHAGNRHFELELDLMHNRALGHVAGGESFARELGGQTAEQLAADLRDYLMAAGVESCFSPDCEPSGSHVPMDGSVRAGYSADLAASFSDVWRGVSAALALFRAGLAEETSPIMLWPGHFDLAMMWLPGEKIQDRDPANEEYSDKQMNFGFSFGDAEITEPYFYTTAYPLPPTMTALSLPGNARWHKGGFTGAVLEYQHLRSTAEPHAELIRLWQLLAAAGREQMLQGPRGV